jgi:hypothetical protein
MSIEPAQKGNKYPQPASLAPKAAEKAAEKPVEIGGPKGPEPTRYGDWERNGRCSDF